MNKYEAIVIFRPEEDQFTKGKEIVKEDFKTFEIKVLNEEDMGARDLAYVIKHSSKGRYINYHIEANPAKIKPLDASLKLKSEILKFVFFREDN
ncbi:MAG: 30S ribosomal protein S6 [Spirochaetales bacterium]|nr:30S ribosomal protein S6 [Spirochaetales bacterium]